LYSSGIIYILQGKFINLRVKFINLRVLPIPERFNEKELPQEFPAQWFFIS